MHLGDAIRIYLKIPMKSLAFLTFVGLEACMKNWVVNPIDKQKLLETLSKTLK